MQTVIATAQRRAPPAKATAIALTTGAPPVIVAVEKPASHPIYGTTPIGRDGFTLERQNIHMLNFWHERATTATNALVDSRNIEDEDPEYDLLNDCQWQVYEAAFKVKINNPSEVAVLLNIVARHAADCVDIEAVLDLEKVQHIAAQLTKATAPLAPKKKLGAMLRGRKLTRFGLLHRYQAFLIQELETIGHHVYGERDYPMQSRPLDDAVNERCATPNARGQSPIFFNPEKLPVRARAVLKSLQIDTERAIDPVTRAIAK